MNAALAVFVLLIASYRTNAAPAPQQLQSQGYHTQSLYPTYNVQHPSFPINTYSNLFSQPAYVQNPLPYNSSDLQKIEADYQAALEKIKKDNEANRAAIKLNDEKVDGKSSAAAAAAAPVGPANVVHPFTSVAGNAAVVGPVFGHHHHAVDPIFGPEIGSKYEIHYAPEHLSSFSDFSAYAGYPVQATFPAQPAPFPATYSAYPAYSPYPNFAGSNPYFGVDATPLNGNKIDALPSNSPAPGVGQPEAPSESSTETANETSSESNVGAPPSIDGPKPTARAFSPTNSVPAPAKVRKTT